MKDWLLDDDDKLAGLVGVDVATWKKLRRELIEAGLLRREIRHVEGPVLRFTHPEHIAMVGLLLPGRLEGRSR